MKKRTRKRNFSVLTQSVSGFITDDFYNDRKISVLRTSIYYVLAISRRYDHTTQQTETFIVFITRALIRSPLIKFLSITFSLSGLFSLKTKQLRVVFSYELTPKLKLAPLNIN